MPIVTDNSFEKDFKTWDYEILDKFAHTGEPSRGERLIKNGYIKRYLNSELNLYSIIRHRNFYSHIVVEAFRGSVNTRSIAHANDGTRETRDDFPVFIDSVNFMKPPKDFRWKAIRSIVRLNSLNDGMGFSRYINQFSICPTFFIIEVTATIENGELCTS